MTTRIRARYTGNKSVTYRWLSEVDGAKLVPAQAHASATVTVDTWSSDVDPRVQRSTRIECADGLVVLDRQDGNYTAGITTGLTGDAAIEWTGRVKHVRSAREDIVRGNPRSGQQTVHYILVDNVERRYVQG